MTSLYTHIVIVRSNMHVAIDYCTPSTFKFHTVFRHTHCHIDINKTPYMASVKVRPYVWTSVLTHLLNSCCTYSSICRLISVSHYILRQSPSTFEKTTYIARTKTSWRDVNFPNKYFGDPESLCVVSDCLWSD